MATLKSIQDGFYFIPKISREDYEALELKIQTEIQKIFSKFIEDLENNTAESDITVPLQDKQKPGRPRKLVQAETLLAPAEKEKHRMAKKSIEIDKILHSTSNSRTNPPIKTLESDMEKILRRKHRIGSQ